MVPLLSLAIISHDTPLQQLGAGCCFSQHTCSFHAMGDVSIAAVGRRRKNEAEYEIFHDVLHAIILGR